MASRTTNSILFRCTACRNAMEADPAMVGRLVECPSCNSSMLVPNRSLRLPPAARRRLWIGLGAGLLAVLLISIAVRLLSSPDSLPPSVQLAKANASTLVKAPGEGGPGPSATVTRAEPDSSFQELAARHRKLGKQYEELANWVLNNMRGRFLLKERFVKNLNLPSVTDGFGLHPDMMDFLEVSPKERDLLEDALDYGLSSMASLESKFLSVTQKAPEHVALYIPPYEREGAAMQEDLYRAMETVLGADRFDRLLDAGEKDLIKRYHYFGTAARTMTFVLTASENPAEQPYLVIRDGWVIPDGPGKRSIQVAESAVRQLPRDYLPYLSWLPEYMAAFAKP